MQGIRQHFSFYLLVYPNIGCLDMAVWAVYVSLPQLLSLPMQVVLLLKYQLPLLISYSTLHNGILWSVLCKVEHYKVSSALWVTSASDHVCSFVCTCCYFLDVAGPFCISLEIYAKMFVFCNFLGFCTKKSVSGDVLSFAGKCQALSLLRIEFYKPVFCPFFSQDDHYYSPLVLITSEESSSWSCMSLCPWVCPAIHPSRPISQ